MPKLQLSPQSDLKALPAPFSPNPSQHTSHPPKLEFRPLSSTHNPIHYLIFSTSVNSLGAILALISTQTISYPYFGIKREICPISFFLGRFPDYWVLPFFSFGYWKALSQPRYPKPDPPNLRVHPFLHLPLIHVHLTIVPPHPPLFHPIHLHDPLNPDQLIILLLNT